MAALPRSERAGDRLSLGLPPSVLELSMHAYHDLFPLPPVFVADADYEQLAKLANDSSSPAAALLDQELERATVVTDGDGFVRLNSTVEFSDPAGRRRTVTLVGPDQADMEVNRLSVTAPTGAALLGLRAGDVFSWTFEGRPRLLFVYRIVGPA